MRLRFGVNIGGFWKITVIARPASDIPQMVVTYLLSLDGKQMGGAGKLFCTVS